MPNPLDLRSLSDVEPAFDKLPDEPALAWALAHCAQSIEFSMTGYPKLRSALFRATIGPIAKRSFMKKGAMKHDLAAPVPGAPELEGFELAAAKDRLRAAIAAFDGFDGQVQPHLAFGRCTKAELDTLHALHIGDHVSSFVD